MRTLHTPCAVRLGAFLLSASPPRRCAQRSFHAAVPEAIDLTATVAERASTAEPAPLSALRADTRDLTPAGAHMCSGAQQGRLLHMLARLCRARNVLEIGSFTGYATIWLAAALPADGTVLALERDERSASVSRAHLAGLGLDARVDLRIGDAMETLRSLPDDFPPFDLVFLDADKRRSPPPLPADITYHAHCLPPPPPTCPCVSPPSTSTSAPSLCVIYP